MELEDFHIEKTSRSEAREFIIDHHYTGSCGYALMSWGLYHKDKLVGAMGFHTPISENVRKGIWKNEYEDEYKNYMTELHRLVTLDECPKNTESWFISRVLDKFKDYKPKYKVVISLADATEGHKGTVYQACSAKYYGTTDKKKFYKDDDGVLHPPRSGGENITLADAKNRGWSVEQREAKHRYMFLLPDPYESKEDIIDKLSVKFKQYP